MNDLMNSAFDIIEEIHLLGFNAHLVGGFVRDLFLNVTPKDADIVTNCPMDVLDSHWKTVEIGQSRGFGIVTINHNGFSFEIAQCREESSSSNSRHPDSVEFVNDIESDLSRRDLTVNSLALDIDGNIIDLFNGREHLIKGLIMTVGKPEDRFEEDVLRIVRAIRFAARLGFSLECETERAIMECSCNLPKLSAERIHDELFKMASLGGKKFAHSIETMNALGILEIILPEVAVMKNFTESPLWHPEAWATGTGTVFDHTMQALRQSPTKDALTNIAILLHDVSKPEVAIFKPQNNGCSFPGHAERAPKLITKIGKRLKFSTEETESISFVALYHMIMFKGDEMRPSKIMKLVNNKNWEMLKIVSFCDDSCREEIFDKVIFDSVINNMESITRNWNEKLQNSKNKVVDGNLVMEITGLKPCKMVGDIIKKVTEEVLDNGDTRGTIDIINDVWKSMNIIS